MAWPSVRTKTAVAGGSWVPADMNGVQDAYLRATGIINDDLDATTLAGILGITQTAAAAGGVAVRRGAVAIPGTETRTNVAYGLMPTPDRVAGVVLPTNGLIAVAFQGLWQESVQNAARAAIFIGANQLKAAQSGGAPIVEETSINSATLNQWQILTTGPGALASSAAGAGALADVTTGQHISLSPNNGGGGVAYIFAAAGTYDVSIQFKASSGNVLANGRKLWVWTIGF